MKHRHLLYIGYYADDLTFERLVESKVNNMSVARQSLESKLLKGLCAISDIELSVVSYIPTRRGLRLPDSTNLDNLQIPYYRINKKNPFSLIYTSLRFCKYIYEHNIRNTTILMYAVNPVFLLPILFCKKRRNLTLITICSEIPRFRRYAKSFKWEIKKKILTLFNKSFDRYILLTDAMSSELGIGGKPYIVVEGIVDDCYSNVNQAHRENVVMYAGGLHPDNNVMSIVDACSDNTDVKELWICGTGPDEFKIRSVAANTAKIKYYGNISHGEVLAMEAKAKLLLNIRDHNNPLTRYSFPSKLMEYLMSGAIVASTRLSGIPIEYFDYVMEVKNTDKDQLSPFISQIMHYSDEYVNKRAVLAREFLLREKTTERQCKKIVDFIFG